MPVARGALEARMFVHKVYSSTVSKGAAKLESSRALATWRACYPGKSTRKDICALICKSRNEMLNSPKLGNLGYISMGFLVPFLLQSCLFSQLVTRIGFSNIRK